MIEAKQRIGVEDEGDEELSGVEFRIVEQCPASVGCFPVTAATSHLYRAVERVESVLTTIRTGSGCLDHLEAEQELTQNRM